MKRIAVAVAVAVAVATLSVSAQVVLTPGDSSYLDPVTGNGLGFVSWDGTSTFAASLSAAGDFGYVVDYATATVVTPMVDISAVQHVIVTTGLVTDNWYYLMTTDVPHSVGASTVGVELQTENFKLVEVPEPGTYALLAGMGLVGFAGWRRWRGRA